MMRATTYPPPPTFSNPQINQAPRINASRSPPPMDKARPTTPSAMNPSTSPRTRGGPAKRHLPASLEDAPALSGAAALFALFAVDAGGGGCDANGGGEEGVNISVLAVSVCEEGSCWYAVLVGCGGSSKAGKDLCSRRKDDKKDRKSTYFEMMYLYAMMVWPMRAQVLGFLRAIVGM